MLVDVDPAVDPAQCRVVETQAGRRGPPDDDARRHEGQPAPGVGPPDRREHEDGGRMRPCGTRAADLGLVPTVTDAPSRRGGAPTA